MSMARKCLPDLCEQVFLQKLEICESASVDQGTKKMAQIFVRIC